MRISDWSSDVCSSDLPVDAADEGALAGAAAADDAQHLARANFERDVVEGGDSGAAGSGKALADPVETDDRPRRAARLRRRNARGGIRWRWGRSEERRVGKEGVRTGRSRWSPAH